VIEQTRTIHEPFRVKIVHIPTANVTQFSPKCKTTDGVYIKQFQYNVKSHFWAHNYI